MISLISFSDLVCVVLTLAIQVTLLTKVIDNISQRVKRIQFSATSVQNVTDPELNVELSLFSVQLHHQKLTLSAADYMTVDFGFVQSVSMNKRTHFTYIFPIFKLLFLSCFFRLVG